MVFSDNAASAFTDPADAAESRSLLHKRSPSAVLRREESPFAPFVEHDAVDRGLLPEPQASGPWSDAGSAGGPLHAGSDAGEDGSEGSDADEDGDGDDDSAARFERPRSFELGFMLTAAGLVVALSVAAALTTVFDWVL